MKKSWLLMHSLAICLLIFSSCSKNASQIASTGGNSVVFIATKSKIGLPLGTGSGFIVSQDGIIVTNFHVIADAHQAAIKLSKGDIYDDVSVINVDPRKDIAVLKIKAKNLKVVQLGNSDKAKTGEKVVAIGNPEGLEQSVSDGVISGTRDSKAGYKMLQITAPISHGSSGGPLFDDQGKVIGITAASLVAEGAQNLNFAIPINYVKELIEQKDSTPLSEFQGKFQEKAWFGTGDDFGFSTPTRKKELKCGSLRIKPDMWQWPNKVIVRDFWSGSPAKKAGLEIGDQIVEINAKPIQNVEDFLNTMYQLKVGETIRLKILRKEKSLSFEFALAETQPPSSPAAFLWRDLYAGNPVRLAVLIDNISITSNIYTPQIERFQEEHQNKAKSELVDMVQRDALKRFGYLKNFSIVDTGKLSSIINGLGQQYGPVTPDVRNKILLSMGVTHLIEVSYSRFDQINLNKAQPEMVRFEHKHKLIDVYDGRVLAVQVFYSVFDENGKEKEKGVIDELSDDKEDRLYWDNLSESKRNEVEKAYQAFETKQLNS